MKYAVMFLWGKGKDFVNKLTLYSNNTTLR